jgi:hypothetical protein
MSRWLERLLMFGRLYSAYVTFSGGALEMTNTHVPRPGGFGGCQWWLGSSQWQTTTTTTTGAGAGAGAGAGDGSAAAVRRHYED